MVNRRIKPFGYGLSYTSFTVSKPEISSVELRKGETLDVSVEVQNTGDREGETVVQLYICDETASLVRPVKELKGCKKVHLKPKESKKVSFSISEETLRFWTENGKFETEEGWFTVWVSDSSDIQDGVRFLLCS